MPCYQPIEVLRYLLAPGQLDLICEINLSSPAGFSPLSSMDYLKLFCLTFLLEAPVYFLVLWPPRPVWFRVLGAILFVNLVTHPLMSFLFADWAQKGSWREIDYIGTSELFAFLVEALLIRLFLRQPWWRSALAAFGANLFSWWLGSLI